MTVFKAPQYTKIVNSKGVQEPCYTFNIDYNTTDCLSFIAEKQDDISLQSIQKCVSDNTILWNTFIGEFLESSVKFFSKPYTIDTIHKITKHVLTTVDSHVYPINVILIPKNIQIHAGIFIINWGYNTEPMIDIPDLEDTPVSDIQGMEELNIDEIPVENSTDVLEIDNPSKYYDKQRVKEARLKAKLSVYKAQRQMAEYCDKYGDEISDSDSESEYTTDDEKD